MKIIKAATIFALLLIQVFSAQAQKTYGDTLAVHYTFTCTDQYDVVKQPDGSLQVKAPLSSAEDKYRESITFNISKQPTGMGLDSLAAYIQRVMINNAGKSNIKPADMRVTPIRIGGIEGRRVSMSSMINFTLATMSESFIIYRGGVLRVSYINEYHDKSHTMPSLEKVFESIKVY